MNIELEDESDGELEFESQDQYQPLHTTHEEQVAEEEGDICFFVFSCWFQLLEQYPCSV
jgi:hypothetical protein